MSILRSRLQAPDDGNAAAADVRAADATGEARISRQYRDIDLTGNPLLASGNYLLPDETGLVISQMIRASGLPALQSTGG